MPLVTRVSRAWCCDLAAPEKGLWGCRPSVALCLHSESYQLGFLVACDLSQNVAHTYDFGVMGAEEVVCSLKGIWACLPRPLTQSRFGVMCHGMHIQCWSLGAETGGVCVARRGHPLTS